MSVIPVPCFRFLELAILSHKLLDQRSRPLVLDCCSIPHPKPDRVSEAKDLIASRSLCSLAPPYLSVVWPQHSLLPLCLIVWQDTGF